jgi:hypothetical protein
MRLNDLLVMPDYKAILRDNGLETVDRWFACTGETSLDKPGLDPWRTRLRVALADGGQRHTFYVKRYDHPPARATRRAVRSGSGARSVAGVEWNWIRQLKRAGIRCVEPVALGESFTDGREIRSLLVTAEVPGDALERVLPTWNHDAANRVRRLISPLADLVAELHRAGFVHRDLYLSHVFLDPDAPLEKALRLIDLQRVRRPRWSLGRWIIKDLAALDYSAPSEIVSRTDRVRWLKRYLDVARLDAHARRLLYCVVGKTRRIARHDARRKAKLDRERKLP